MELFGGKKSQFSQFPTYPSQEYRISLFNLELERRDYHLLRLEVNIHSNSLAQTAFSL